MGFRFFRRVKVAPGVTLNFSKSGLSTSFGVRGARVTVGRRGLRKTVGIPGTGLYYSEVSGGGRQRRSRSAERSRPQPPPPEHQLDLGFFQRLWTPKGERGFVDGCREYVAGNPRKALATLRQADGVADAAFLAAFLAMDVGDLNEAEHQFKRAWARHRTLGRHFGKYGLQVELALPITEHVTAHIRPGLRGVLLGLTEVYQAQGRFREAVDCLKRLHREAREDVVVQLSLAELLWESRPEDKRTAKQIVAIAGDAENTSSVHAALLLYKARALRALGLLTAARDTLTAALRRKKDRDPQLLNALRFERACVYEALGQRTRARREFEKVYAADPQHEEVAQRLGI